ncbi:hypothetical protein RND81_05G232500 [Saponaria officinalis]|uniref:Uncharacterized protein n=1 Tax=Saponaria officinalis TaxID=3572 RepID=A0AAW1L0G6_SAPOF
MDVFHTMKVVFFVIFITLYGVCSAAKDPSTVINAIYQFGDSVSDTGNTFHEAPGVGCSKAPYGVTYFGHPTGRCSDGLLIVDYLTQAFKLPFLKPYLDKSNNVSNGVNFAVAGSTALDLKSLAKKNITAVGTPSSLPVQLDWFKSHLATLCSNHSECKQKLENSLFIVGTTGGNDYNSAGLAGLQDFQNLMLDIVNSIREVVKKLISLGATRIVVPGSFPVGCIPAVQNGANKNDATLFDEFGCVKSSNDFSALHNDKLRRAIETLQHYPDVKLVYGDYFSPFLSILKNATSLGFDKNSLFEACCSMCGSPGGRVCPNPKSRVSWDGLHLTEHAYQVVAIDLLKQIEWICTPSAISKQ